MIIFYAIRTKNMPAHATFVISDIVVEGTLKYNTTVTLSVAEGQGDK
jgi:hypothetical protein